MSRTVTLARDAAGSTNRICTPRRTGFAPGIEARREVFGQDPCLPGAFGITASRRMDCAVKQGRVLLADRHLGMLGGVHSLLDSLFDSVLMVADERSLDDAAATLTPDLVVVDLSLPRGSEANIAGRLLGRHPKLRLIVLSVHDEPTIVGQLLGAGVAGFVLKRAAATDLVPAVREVLRGGTYVSPALRVQLPGSRDQSPTGATDAPGTGSSP